MTTSSKVHIATRVDSQLLLAQPEVVLQSMSIKIFERRQKLMQELVGTKIVFETTQGLRSGVIENIEETFATVRDNNQLLKVNLKKLTI